MQKRKVGLVALTLMLMSIPLISNAVKLNDLLVYLPMDEGKGNTVEDASDNDFDADIVGGAKWVAGQFGEGLELAVADEVQIEDDPAIDGGDEFTIAMWVFQEGEQSTGLIQKGTNWPDISYLIQPWNDGQIYFGVNVTASRAITKPGDHSLGKWYHLAGTFDGKDLKLFINGTLKAEATAPVKTAPDTDAPLQLGNRFEGKIDEFVMYSRALSEDEIKLLFENDFLAVAPLDKLAKTWGTIKSRSQY